MGQDMGPIIEQAGGPISWAEGVGKARIGSSTLQKRKKDKRVTVFPLLSSDASSNSPVLNAKTLTL